MASNVQTFAIPASSGVVGDTTANEGVYYGFSARETAGTAAVFRVRSGGVIGGKILDTIALAANESRAEIYLPQGVKVSGGLYYEKVSGTIEGAIRYG